MKERRDVVESKRCRLMNHPSMEILIPCEPIGNCGLTSVSARDSYICHFHHNNKEEAFYTRVEVLCLETQCNVAEMFYTWDGVPEWTVNPQSQGFDSAVCKSLATFVTGERYLGYLSLPPQCDDQVSLLDLSPYLPPTRPLRVSVSCIVDNEDGSAHVCALMGFASEVFIVIVEPATKGKEVDHITTYRLDTLRVSRLFGNHSIIVTPDHFIISLNYYTVDEQLHLAIFALSRSDDQVLVLDEDSKDRLSNIVGLTLSKSRKNTSTVCTLSCYPFGSWKISNIGNALFDLAVSFSMPFGSLIQADVSNMYTLSAKLNSPWAMPVALVHIPLFFIFCPFLILPETKTCIDISVKDKSLSVNKRIRLARRCRKRRKRALIEGEVLLDLDDEDWSLPADLVIMEQTSKFIRIRKYRPDERTRFIYAKPKTLRILSIFCYLICLAGFVISMWFVLTRMETSKFDLLVQLGLADAASIFALAISQDLASTVPWLAYYLCSSPS